MCNVCVAEQALATTACGKANCVALGDGFQVAWTTAPTIDFKKALSSLYSRSSLLSGRRRVKSKRARRRGVSIRASVFAFGLLECPTVFVRARGKGAETRGEFQVRRQGGAWPKEWQKTDDVAGAMAMYGLDIKWKYVPKLVQDWARFETSEMPTLDALHEALDAEPVRRHVKRRVKVRARSAKSRTNTKVAAKRV